MAYYQISQFYYNSETNNIIVQFALVGEAPEYETNAGDLPYDVYEAQIYLDAGQSKVGQYIPGSADGSIDPQTLGRDIGQSPEEEPDVPLPPA